MYLVYFLTKEIIPFMKNQKNGTIINIGSTASLKGYPTGRYIPLQNLL